MNTLEANEITSKQGRISNILKANDKTVADDLIRSTMHIDSVCFLTVLSIFKTRVDFEVSLRIGLRFTHLYFSVAIYTYI